MSSKLGIGGLGLGFIGFKVYLLGWSGGGAINSRLCFIRKYCNMGLKGNRNEKCSNLPALGFKVHFSKVRALGFKLSRGHPYSMSCQIGQNGNSAKTLVVITQTP